MIDTLDPKYNIYLDQTGQFPVRFRVGHRYIMVMVKIVLNYVLVQLTKNKSNEKILTLIKH